MGTKDSERLARIEQKLSDFLETHRAEHRTIDMKLDALVKFKGKVDQPVKWVGSAVVLSAAALATWAVEHGATWAKNHFIK